MARPRSTHAKREREMQRMERAQQKAARRVERKDNERPRGEGEEDPDIAGIVPGPQPTRADDEL